MESEIFFSSHFSGFISRRVFTLFLVDVSVAPLSTRQDSPSPLFVFERVKAQKANGKVLHLTKEQQENRIIAEKKTKAVTRKENMDGEETRHWSGARARTNFAVKNFSLFAEKTMNECSMLMVLYCIPSLVDTHEPPPKSSVGVFNSILINKIN